MRYLAIDPGGKRTGFAVGDDITRIASPASVVEAVTDEARLSAIIKAIEEHEPGELVLGLPLNMDGSDGAPAKQARALAATLTQRTGLVVHLVDERLTSYAAEEKLGELNLTRGGKKERRDAIAAALILRDFLERDAHTRDE